MGAASLRRCQRLAETARIDLSGKPGDMHANWALRHAHGAIYIGFTLTQHSRAAAMRP